MSVITFLLPALFPSISVNLDQVSTISSEEIFSKPKYFLHFSILLYQIYKFIGNSKQVSTHIQPLYKIHLLEFANA